MLQHAHILISGRDSKLLRTRERVLQSAGYCVSTTLQPIELSPDLKNVHLLIACHTLSAAEQQKDLSALAAGAPGAQAVCLSPYPNAGACDTENLVPFWGPREMLQVVGRLLTS